MTPRTAFRPALTNLEGRDLMAATVALNPGTGVLAITCDNANDTIVVTQDARGIVVNNQRAFATNAVSGIVVNGNGGHDRIDLRSVTKPATVNGGSGNDVIVGTLVNDALNGGNDHDTIYGHGGNDRISGDSGNDKLFGDAGNDSLFGGAGNDFLDDGNRNAQEYADGGADFDFNADVWVTNGVAIGDIRQGQLGSCSFLASLAGGIKAGINYGGWIRYLSYDASTGMPIYEVKLWNPTTGYFSQRIGFDGTTNQYDTKAAEEGESWVILMQRAFVNYTPGKNGESSPTQSLPSVTGVNAVRHYANTDANAKNALIAAMNNNRPVVAGINRGNLYGLNGHAVAIVGARGTAANPEFLVYNPWGMDGANAQGQGVPVQGANDGYFWVTWSTLRQCCDYGFYTL